MNPKRVVVGFTLLAPCWWGCGQPDPSADADTAADAVTQGTHVTTATR